MDLGDYPLVSLLSFFGLGHVLQYVYLRQFLGASLPGFAFLCLGHLSLEVANLQTQGRGRRFCPPHGILAGRDWPAFADGASTVTILGAKC